MAEPAQEKSGWTTLALVGASALITLVAADLALSTISPVPPAIMEVDDGVQMLREADPQTLVLGSSHTRSFVPMRQLLLDRTGGANTMALVPIEWGIFSSYLWVTQNRIATLIDERRDGALVRPSLKRVLLITTFYDMCDVQHIGNVNLPARAWELSHFTADLRAKGLTEFNRNYLQTHWKSVFPGSVLIQNRGHERVADALRELARPIDEERRREIRAEKVVWAIGNMERQNETCWPALEREALDDLLDFFISRQIEPTIVLFPLLPDIVSDKSRATVLARYAEYAAELGRRRGIRVVDMTYGAPLEAKDFQDDFDHLTAEANPNFARWALDAHLPFLLEPVTGEGRR